MTLRLFASLPSFVAAVASSGIAVVETFVPVVWRQVLELVLPEVAVA